MLPRAAWKGVEDVHALSVQEQEACVQPSPLVVELQLLQWAVAQQRGGLQRGGLVGAFGG